MNITVEVKHVYGRITIYPACETSQLLAKLASHKILTPTDLRVIKQLGYTVEVATPTI